VALGELFGPGARVAELRGRGDPRALFPEEACSVARAVDKRVQEFAAGRICARRLLAMFGVNDFALRVGEDRQPVWPEGLAGSITHTCGFCAAVVALRSDMSAVGIDSELAGSVKPELWNSICTPSEVGWLQSLPGGQQVGAATLVFSAKEAFYKCQYPLTGQFLGFHDVRVEAQDWGGQRGIFQVHATRDIAIAEHAELPMQGRYLLHEQFLTTGIALLNTPCRRETP
jgi:4'-phosphopantetheinyl transferase EntD